MHSGSDVAAEWSHYLNNIVEQDHRAIKRRINASLGFRSFAAAGRTIQGYEAIHMIRKGQFDGWQSYFVPQHAYLQQIPNNRSSRRA